MFGDSSPLLPGAIRVGSAGTRGDKKLRGLFQPPMKRLSCMDASMSFWANVSGLNVEAYSLGPGAFEMTQS